jgi:hypothetical protein
MSKKIITKKQQTLLTLLYVFRFLNSKQIQQFLQHKDHRRINSWLKDLKEKEYLKRDFSPIYGILTKPAVYHLSVKGRAYIRNTYEDASIAYLRRLGEDTKRSKGFRIKCQLIADCYLILSEDSVNEFPSLTQKWLKDGVILKYNKFQFLTAAFYEELDFALLSPLKPDMYGHIEDKKGKTHALLYVVDAYVPRLMLRYMIKKIFTVLDEEYWEEDDVTSLHIYFLCPSNMVIIYLKRLLTPLLESYYGNTPLHFLFATRNQLYKRQREHLKVTGWSIVSSTDY